MLVIISIILSALTAAGLIYTFEQNEFTSKGIKTEMVYLSDILPKKP